MKLFRPKNNLGKKHSDSLSQEHARHIQDKRSEQKSVEEEMAEQISLHLSEVQKVIEKLRVHIHSATTTGNGTNGEVETLLGIARNLMGVFPTLNPIGQEIGHSDELKATNETLFQLITECQSLTTLCDENCVLRVYPFEHSFRNRFGEEKAARSTRPMQRRRYQSRTTDWTSLYKPLTPWQTRLIELRFSGIPGSLPSCRMVTVELTDISGVGISGTSDVVHYTALSYSWGRGTLGSEIVCDGLPLPIPDSLAEAIFRLADKDAPVYLWCDAICVNQNDHLEKSRQVQNMLRIFEKADKIVAWLGEPKSELVARSFDCLSEHTIIPFVTANGRIHDPCCQKSLSDIQSDVADLCQSAWFTRTWIRQEVFATKTLIFQLGGRTIPFEMFLRNLEFVLSLRMNTKTQRIFRIPVNSWKDVENPVLPAGFWTLQKHFGHEGVDEFSYKSPQVFRRYTYHWLKVLQDGVNFGVSDERDRVYGVLGIVQSITTKFYVEDRVEIRRNRFPLSYDKSVSEVYQDVVKHLINTDRNLDVLTIFEDRRNRADDVPSWVPDWRHKIKRHFFIQSPHDAESERKKNPTLLQDHSDLGKLHLDGICRWKPIDIVTLAYPAQEDDGFFPSYKYTSGGEKWYPSLKFLGLGVGGIFNISKGYAYSFLEALPPGKYEPVDPYRMKIMVPRQTQLDDIVVKFKGSPCLHVLRKLRSGEFLFIGPCLAWHEGSWGKFDGTTFRNALCLDKDEKNDWESHPVERFVLV